MAPLGVQLLGATASLGVGVCVHTHAKGARVQAAGVSGVMVCEHTRVAVGWREGPRSSQPGQLYPDVPQTNAYAQRSVAQGGPQPSPTHVCSWACHPSIWACEHTYPS